MSLSNPRGFCVLMRLQLDGALHVPESGEWLAAFVQPLAELEIQIRFGLRQGCEHLRLVFG
jgi:hypothetical protein